VALTIKSHIDDDEWASNIAQTQQDRQITPNGSEDAIDKKFLDDLMGKFRAMQSRSNKQQGRTGDSQDFDDVPYAAKIAQMLNEAVQNKSALLRDECSICLDPISIHDSVVTPCFHIFCKECLVGVLRKQPLPGQQTEATNASIVRRLPNGPCPVCNVPIDSSRILLLSESDGRIETSFLKCSMTMKSAETKTEENDGVARQTLETAVRGSSSSKLTAILDELDRIWQEEPGSKVLIFSQFLGFLDLIEEAFKQHRIPFARLDGKLSLRDRMAVLQEFGSDNGGGHRVSTSGTKPDAGSVLLISMKAGGVGLNLVAARTVFIADPWWNAAVEDQCVDRIHRIGQTADKVRVRKFYIRNSVEERIVELQSRKKSMASQVLCDKGQVESDGENGSRPTLEDFKILFRDDARAYS
jgi:SNF2 family DNA or RNA helicase